jgi:GNAT superfamily N-acetyltransferase
MHPDLFAVLKANLGQPLSPDLCADIMLAADQMPTLVHLEKIERIQTEQYGEFTFAVEKMEDTQDEIKPLHLAHWNETEGHRHGLPFNPDYQTFERYERAGRFVLFTVRLAGELLGHCSMYLDQSTHTKTLIATEDALYLLPQARKGRVASRFVAFVENSLKQIGAREICITVKTVNRAGKFFRALGYRHVEDGLVKVLED